VVKTTNMGNRRVYNAVRRLEQENFAGPPLLSSNCREAVIPLKYGAVKAGRIHSKQESFRCRAVPVFSF
jgi:hypothetical protein